MRNCFVIIQYGNKRKDKKAYIAIEYKNDLKIFVQLGKTF